MAQILDYYAVDVSPGIVSRAAERLRQGELIGLPFDAAYLPCGLASRENVARRLANLDDGHTTYLLAFAQPQDAIDAVEPLSEVHRRLLSRLWPGPVRFHFVDANKVSATPPDMQDARIELAVPESLACREILAEAGDPVAVPGGFPGATSAGQLESSCGDRLAVIVDAGAPVHRYPPTVVELTEEGWHVARAGAVPERRIAEAACFTILFVCTGNTCRSPMAERLFRKMLAARLKCREGDLSARGFLVRSAGLAAYDGAPASPEAVELMRREGTDLSDHHSQPATDSLLSQSNQILTMTQRHRETILGQFPHLKDRTRTLAADGGDIADPFGGDSSEYDACRRQIERHLKELLEEFDWINGGETS